MGPLEFSLVGRRATGGKDEPRFERFAEVREDLQDRPRLGDEYDQPDVAATPAPCVAKIGIINAVPQLPPGVRVTSPASGCQRTANRYWGAT